MAKRISHKNVGEVFEVRFEEDALTEKHMLVGYHSPTADKSQDTADFRAVDENGIPRTDTYGVMWTAYRFNGRWCYGTSADILVVVK
jgi:hypothetical protein